MLNAMLEVSAKKIVLVPKNQRLFRILSILLLFGLIAASFYVNIADDCSGQNIKVNDYKICASVADSSSERTKGLSGREYLDKNEGMLFVFEETDKHGIWMKDMLISIDIIWLGDNRRVTHIEKNISPDSYPTAFYPKSPSKYVVEVATGLVDELGLNIGDKIEW